MIYQGSFNDIKGRTVTVRIESGTGTETRAIGEPEGGLYFSPNPVETTHAYNDQFDTVMRESCTLRLLSAEPLSQLYSRDVMDNKVTVTRDDEVIFMGYVEPQAFSQPFNSRLDEVELSCIDLFSALQYLLWEDVSREDVDYDQKKAAATQMNVGSILAKCLAKVAPGMTVSYAGEPVIGTVSVLQCMIIDTTTFFGDDEEGTWTLLDVVDSLLQYLNLRMCLHGGQVKIYHPDKLGTGAAVTIDRTTVWDKNHQMEVSETFNKLSLSVERDTVEEVVPHILNEDTLERLYSGRQLWCSEYMAPRSWDIFYLMGLSPQNRAVEAGGRKDHYIRVLDAPGWKFGGIQPPGYTGHLNDYLDYYSPETTAQEVGANELQPNMAAMLLEVATGVQKYGYEDNAVSSDLNTAKYLVIGTNGQTSDTANDTEAIADGYSTKLRAAMPVAEYTGASVTLSPNDEDTTRYVVFSGSMRLNPVHVQVEKTKDFLASAKSKTKPWADAVMADVLKDTKTTAQRAAYDWCVGKFAAAMVIDPWILQDVCNGNGAPASCDMTVVKRVYQHYVDEGISLAMMMALNQLPRESYDKDAEGEELEHKRYYLRRYWHCDTPESTPVAMDEYKATVPVNYGLFPVENDDLYASLEYKYSAGGGNAGQSIDEVNQLPLLQCMLTVGDKCVVQTGRPEDSDNLMDCYEWRLYKTRAQCASDEEYYQQSFTLGIDIKIKDKIIGPEYDIANNIPYRLGIDAKGTAIPVRKSDNVSGAVKFMILGPFNMLWEDIIRRAPNTWRHTQWSEKSVVLLNHVSAIWMKDFAVEIKTDHADDSEDGDLVYTSDTDEAFVNKKDDLTFRIASGLTTEERKLLSVPDAVCRNTPINSQTGGVVLSIRDTVRGVSGKPERLYLDWHWNKAHRARISLIHGLKDVDNIVDRFNCYTHPALEGKEFCVDGISRNLKDGSAQIRMTEK